MAVASSRLQTSGCGREHSLPEAGMLVAVAGSELTQSVAVAIVIAAARGHELGD